VPQPTYTPTPHPTPLPTESGLLILYPLAGDVIASGDYVNIVWRFSGSLSNANSGQVTIKVYEYTFLKKKYQY
jgi:hypothetical protein